MDITGIKRALADVEYSISEAEDAISNANHKFSDIEVMLDKDKSCREHSLMMREMSIQELEELIEKANEALRLRLV